MADIPQAKKDWLSEVLPSDWQSRLIYVALKSSLAPLDMTKEDINRLPYYITDTRIMSEPYMKELLAAFRSAREKNLHADLVVLDRSSSWKIQENLQTYKSILPEVCIPENIKDEEAAVLVKGAIGIVALDASTSEGEDALEDYMQFSTPLIVSHQDSIESIVGHAALYLEKMNREGMSNALIKVENSERLREHLRDVLIEHIRED